MVYYARKAGVKRSMPLMPATPFIFEYFLFNSIYQVDWETSFQGETGCILSHEKNDKGRVKLKESEQQEKLLKYLEKECGENSKFIERAFAPFKYLIDLNGSWMKSVPGQNLSKEDGENFILSVKTIQDLLCNGVTKNDVPKFFEHINQCREYVGKVRNNIFHGVKSLSQISEGKQSRRIELYHLVIQSINSLFFLTIAKKSNVASDHVFNPIEVRVNDDYLRLRSMAVLELFVKGMIKREDSELIGWASKQFETLREQGTPSGAMFYPSACCDVITPILIGIPFCTDFYFYNKDNISKNKLAEVFKELLTVLGISYVPEMVTPTKNGYQIEFEYAGISRRIFHMKADNSGYLSQDSNLRFLFRRGDSFGEGGSDQPWDNDWVPHWKAKIPTGQLCAVLTDGKPHVINPELAEELSSFPSSLHSGRSKKYYGGVISSPH